MRNLLALVAVLFFSVALAAQSSRPTDFTAIAMDGGTVDTAQLRGKIIVLNLWFINCPNCIEEIKLLNQLVDQYKDNKQIVFLSLAASKRPDLEKFLQKNPFKYRNIPDATIIILTKFGTPDKNGEINVPFPMHYVLDRDGNVAVKAQGIKGVDAVKKELERIVNMEPAAAK